MHNHTYDHIWIQWACQTISSCLQEAYGMWAESVGVWICLIQTTGGFFFLRVLLICDRTPLIYIIRDLF